MVTYLVSYIVCFKMAAIYFDGTPDKKRKLDNTNGECPEKDY